MNVLLNQRKKEIKIKIKKNQQQKLQKLQKKSIKSPRISRTWCNLSIDFSESNSLDPEGIDSSFPIFDVSFVPIFKENVSNWKKPFIDTLRVNKRMTYTEFSKQTNIDKWIEKNKDSLPSNIGLFKCEHQITPNKTKMNNFIQVNKLLSDKKRVGFAQYRSEYKMYFIPSTSALSQMLNKKYQNKMETLKDRMWVIWYKIN